MDNNNQHEALIRRQQHEQQRQRFLQQQQQQQLPFSAHLGHHQGPNQLLTSDFAPPQPPPFLQQHQTAIGMPPAPQQQRQHPYGPISVSSSSPSADPRSEQFMSNSSRNSTLTLQHQHPAEPTRGPLPQGPSKMYEFGGSGSVCDSGMSAGIQAQEAEALASHRQQFQQYQQRLLQEQEQRRASTSTPETPRLPSAHPFQSQESNISPWQQQQPQYLWRIQSQQDHASQRRQRSPIGIPRTPFLAPMQATSTARHGSSSWLSSPTSGRRESPISSSSSSSSYPTRGGPIGFGRVNPYPPPQLTSRNQDHQYHRRAAATIDVDALPNLNPDPALRRYDLSQQQSQRSIHPPLLTTSQSFAGSTSGVPFTSPPAGLIPPPPPPTYDLSGGVSGSEGYGNGGEDGYDSACPHEPRRPIETVLPAQAPILIYGPRNSGGGMGDDGGAGDDLMMEYTLEEEQGPPPIEVTLNIDIPKSSRPPTEGVPSTTVLNVNPSWHVVFVETVQQQRIRTSIRIQFCPSSSTARLIEHRSKVCRLQTVQVIGYASRRVELSRRIQGQTLLNRGGLVIHLDPTSITFNEASYGFTLSLTSFEMDQLSRTHNSRPDTPLPLARQQNSAYCRRNLKEMYYDTVSKDVAIALRPSGEIFYAHSVVLESHAYFRALIEQQSQSRSAMTGQDAEEEGSSMAVETEAVVDEEGYAQPLRSKAQQRSLGSSRYPLGGGSGSFGIGGGKDSGLASQDRSRTKTLIEVNDTSPTVFRAVLHFMYMGHVPVTGVFANQAPQLQQQQQQQQQAAATFSQGGQANAAEPGQDIGTSAMSAAALAVNANEGVESGSDLPGMTGLEVLVAATLAATEAASGASSSSRNGPSSALSTSTVDRPMGPPPSSPTPIVSLTGAPIPSTAAIGVTTTSVNSNAPVATAAPPVTTTTTIVGEFPWREVYAIATRYQLSGLMHLAKVALLSRLDVDRAVRELFEWAYHHKPLIPAYVSFLIERVDATVLNGRRSILWPYHDLCPAYDEIMMEFMKLLSERKNASTLI